MPRRLFFKIASNTVSAIVGITTTILSLGMVAAAYAGYIDPELIPLAGVAVMTFPFWVPVMVVVFVADALWWHRSAVIASMALAVCLPQIVDVFPAGTSVPARDLIGNRSLRSFSLMSYNCSGWFDLTKKYTHDNPTANLILRTDADIVCLQESDNLKPRTLVHLTQAQVDSLHARYPYIIETDWHLMLMSKFPACEVDLGLAGGDLNADETTAYKVDLGPGSPPLMIFSVHLQSFGFTPEDKALYGDITSLDADNPVKDNALARDSDLSRRIRSALIGKLSAANMRRAEQVKRLLAHIRRVSAGYNVVVCGDFNDVPCCYALHQLESEGFRQVFPNTCRGYMATFNREKMWFRIDHVLWRGSLTPLRMHRISTLTSDHYPLVTSFGIMPEADAHTD